MKEFTFRQAMQTDLEKICEIIVGDQHQVSTQVITKLYGFKEVSEALELFTAASQVEKSWRKTILVELDGEIVGVLQVPNSASLSSSSGSSLKVIICYIPILLFRATRILGPLFLWKLRFPMQLEQRVQIDVPADAYKISEIHVVPTHRGQGIGRQMLEYAEEDARASGFAKMALKTRTSNPAQKLYERYGFTIAETRTDGEFEQLAGTSGNILMIKELD